MEWDEYFMGFARHAAKKSKDTTKVGAVLVGPEGEVRLTGYNGFPRGVSHLPERSERPAKYMFTSHAESNIIAFAARNGIRTEGCDLYVTHFPCAGCMKMIIQAGIRNLICEDGGFGSGDKWSEEIAAAKVMAREAGVNVHRFVQSVKCTDI